MSKQKFMYCLMQLLTWEIDTRKHKTLLKCEDCIQKDKCEKYGKENANKKRD